MKLTYRRCGDYYLPNIGIPAEDMRPLGKYGRMRMRYLREHRSLLFNQLLLSGKLMKHLYSIDDACQERLDLLIPQMKAAEGVTEDLKAADQMEWVRRMNSIHNRIEEMLFNGQEAVPFLQQGDCGSGQRLFWTAGAAGSRPVSGNP